MESFEKKPKEACQNGRRLQKTLKKGFKDLQAKFREKSVSYTQVKRAAIFYVLNRTSFSGTTLSGGMAVDYDKPEQSLDRRLPRFGKSSRDRIRDFSVKNFTVSKMDFRKSIPKNKNSLIYADPPYFIENKGSLYGNRGDKMFSKQDHEDLAAILNKIKNKKWILSYNDNKYIRKLYSGRRIKTIQWAYGMSGVKSRKKKHSNEILILSDAIV